MPQLLVVDETVRERTTLADDLRERGFDVTTTLDTGTNSLTAIVVAIDSATVGSATLPPCARSEPAQRVPIIVVADGCGPDVRLQAAIEGAALWLEGRASVEAIEHAIGLVAGPAAPPLPDQRRQARIAALAALARTERAAAVPDRCEVRVTRLEHAPARTAARDADRPALHPALAHCTPKQRELLDVIARAGSVTNAAIVLGSTRNNLYATLRRIAHRAGLRDSSELLRAIGLRVSRPARRGRDEVPLDARLIAIDDLDARVPVVVGCSGGPDSLALLYLLRARELAVVAVYVDHGLRAGTEHDARVVADACARFGAVARVEQVDLAAGSNVEARARDARYAALERVRQEVGASAIAVAHTLDDQAETVLLNFLRGSGTAGLAGMSGTRGWVRRPLLGVRRAETHECCARLGLAPVTDPMNSELRHRRVWLRREVIPRLEQGARRDLVTVLGRQAELLRADDEYLESLAAEQATAEVAVLSALPAALARRIVRNWVATNSSGGLPPSSAVVDRVLAVARGDTLATELPGGDRVIRAAGHLRLAPTTNSSHRAEYSFDESSTRSGEGDPERAGDGTSVRLAVPGRSEFGGLAVETWIEHSPPVAWPDGRFDAVCDADTVADQLDEFVIRGPEPGERFRPLGRGGSKPIRDALAEAGVPSADRDTSPVVAARDPVWVVGYRIDHRVRVTSSTRRFLWLSVEPLTNA